MFESFCKPPWSTQYISIVFEDGKVYQTAISSTRFGTDESQNNLFTTWALIVTQEQMLVVCRFGRGCDLQRVLSFVEGKRKKTTILFSFPNVLSVSTSYITRKNPPYNMFTF